MSEGFDPVAYINAPLWQASRLGLHRMEELLERLGRPQDALAFAHVAGTNGKGSTCAYLDSVLRCAGVRTGLFTSPFIEEFEERIRVGGAVIGAEELRAATLEVREAAEAMAAEAGGEHPTEFELMFAVALVHFRAAGVQLAVVEVGLGGRLDATNVIEAPEVCVVTRIGLDHVALLGHTLGAIAREKAGIIKPGCPVITCEQEPEAAEVLARVCAERGCELLVVRDADVRAGAIDWEAEPPARSFSIDFAGTQRDGANGLAQRAHPFAPSLWVPFRTRLLGAYQPENAAVALRACEVLRRAGWPITEDAERQGIARAVWPARFEVLGREPLFIVDGAHNADGARALVRSLEEVRAGSPAADGDLIVVMSVLADKDLNAMAAAVAPLARQAFAFEAPSPRALPAEELAAALDAAAGRSLAVACGSAAEAVERALEAARPNDVVVACGSLYSVAAIKEALLL